MPAHLWQKIDSRASAVQGHALFVRQAGGVLPCPQVDFVGGFNGFFAAAYNLGKRSIEEAFGSPFNPFLNDQNFVVSVLTLEEFGATGNKVSAIHTSQSVGLHSPYGTCAIFCQSQLKEMSAAAFCRLMLCLLYLYSQS